MNHRAITLLSVGMIVGAVAGAGLGFSLPRVNAQSAAAAPASSAKQYTYRGREDRLKTPRIPPVDPNDFTPAQKAAAMAMGSPNGGNGNFRAALYSPDLAQAWHTWLRFVHDNPGAVGPVTRADAGDALPLIDKELVVLRTNYLNHDAWVWSAHVPMAIAWGRSEAEVARIAQGPEAPGWNEKDAALVRAADELRAQAFITDQTWNTLAKYYNTRQMLDILFLAGVYTTNAYYVNSVGLPFEPGMRILDADVVWGLPE